MILLTYINTIQHIFFLSQIWPIHSGYLDCCATAAAAQELILQNSVAINIYVIVVTILKIHRWSKTDRPIF